MLLVLDFDGTVADRDTLDIVAERFAPDAFAEIDAEFQAGRLGLDETIAREMAGVTASLDDVLAFLRAEVRPRPGLPELLAFCADRFIEPVVVSSGLAPMIRPLLVDWGLGSVALRAHDATFTPEGAIVHFRGLPICDVCGEACKRGDVRRLAAGRRVAYVGDGASDTCAALMADLAFARDSLARQLDAAGRSYVPYADFHDVLVGLRADLP